MTKANGQWQIANLPTTAPNYQSKEDAQDRVLAALADGWEPFAVANSVLWLKRWKEDIVMPTEPA